MMILWMRQKYVKNGIIKSKTLHLQGVYINCQKLMSLLWGKYQLDIVYFGNFVLHMSSHLSTTCKIPPTMKKSLNITSWINGWFSAWTQNGDFSEWKKNIIWQKYLSAHVLRVVHTKIYHNYIIGVMLSFVNGMSEFLEGEVSLVCRKIILIHGRNPGFYYLDLKRFKWGFPEVLMKK